MRKDIGEPYWANRCVAGVMDLVEDRDPFVIIVWVEKYFACISAACSFARAVHRQRREMYTS